MAIFGSTGSIGTQALEVIAGHPDLFSVEILTAQTNEDLLIEQALTFQPDIVVIGDDQKYLKVKDALSSTGIQVMGGEEALVEAAAVDCYDMMIAAIVGFAGLRPTMQAIAAG